MLNLNRLFFTRNTGLALFAFAGALLVNQHVSATPVTCPAATLQTGAFGGDHASQLIHFRWPPASLVAVLQNSALGGDHASQLIHFRWPPV